MQVVYRTLWAGSHPHRHALTAKEVVFGDGGGAEGLFFSGFVVYMVFRPHTESVGVFGVAFIEMCAACARIGNQVLAVGGAVGADLDGLGRDTGAVAWVMVRRTVRARAFR